MKAEAMNETRYDTIDPDGTEERAVVRLILQLDAGIRACTEEMRRIREDVATVRDRILPAVETDEDRRRTAWVRGTLEGDS